ncbi:MAG: polyprenyl synthetase family protein [Acidobacteriota bacterium]
MTIRRGSPSARIESVLAECGALVGAAVEPYLARQAGRPYLGPLIADYPGRRSPILGAALFLATIRACGGRIDDGLRVAAAIEMTQNAARIHQDLWNRRDRRSGRQSLHRLWGEPLAINAGDALLMMGLQPLLTEPRDLLGQRSLVMLHYLDTMSRYGIQAQMAERFWRQEGVFAPSEADYFRTVLGKTCWPLIIGPLLMASWMARISRQQVDSWIRFGYFWGVALNIRTEVNWWSALIEEGSWPAPSVGARQFDLPLVHLSGSLSDGEKQRILTLLEAAESGPPAAGVLDIGRQLEATGCLDSSLATSSRMHRAAVSEAERLMGALPATRERDLLLDLARWEGPPQELR